MVWSTSWSLHFSFEEAMVSTSSHRSACERKAGGHDACLRSRPEALLYICSGVALCMFLGWATDRGSDQRFCFFSSGRKILACIPCVRVTIPDMHCICWHRRVYPNLPCEMYMLLWTTLIS